MNIFTRLVAAATKSFNVSWGKNRELQLLKIRVFITISTVSNLQKVIYWLLIVHTTYRDGERKTNVIELDQLCRRNNYRINRSV